MVVDQLRAFLEQGTIAQRGEFPQRWKWRANRRTASRSRTRTCPTWSDRFPLRWRKPASTSTTWSTSRRGRWRTRWSTSTAKPPPEVVAAHRAHPRRALDPRRAAAAPEPRDERASSSACARPSTASTTASSSTLNERAQLARAIGTLKVGPGLPPGARGAGAARASRSAIPGPLTDETVALLFREIMSACLALERPITVAYLGPEGHVQRERRDEALRPRRRGPARALDRRGVPRGRSRAPRTSASCRWRIPPRARSAARSTSCRKRR